MHISSIDIYKSKIPLKEPFIISLGSFDYATNVVVAIRTNNGYVGFGECSPFPTIHGETADTCMIIGELIGSRLLGKDPLELAAHAAMMDQLIHGNTSIKSAFDIALHDIASGNAGMPLYAFLGGQRKPLLTDYTISLSSPMKMAADAAKILSWGFTVIKVKLGGKPKEDLLRIQLIREKIGNEITLRIDANQGWSSSTALSTLKALAQYNIQHCEEPIPRWDFMQLPEIRKQSPIPIMADESCCDYHDAQRLIDLQACDSLNVKLGKSSGIFKALKIIRKAEQTEMPLQMGGFLESRLGFTASAHLALTSKNFLYFDFDTPLMFSKDPVSGGIIYKNGGEITVPDSPGLGASYDPDFLNSLPKIHLELPS